MRRVRRANPRATHSGAPDTEQTLWSMCRGIDTAAPITAVLAAYGPAVELHFYCGGERRRELRFLGDLAPVKYAERVRARLETRGYSEVRRDLRSRQWFV